MNLLSKLTGVAALALMAGCTTMEPPTPQRRRLWPRCRCPGRCACPAGRPAPVAARPRPRTMSPSRWRSTSTSRRRMCGPRLADWCDISKLDHADGRRSVHVTSGDGDVGSVRLIAGRVTEVMTAKSEFGYGYTQPNVEGKWYNLYHGFMEVRPSRRDIEDQLHADAGRVRQGRPGREGQRRHGRRKASSKAALANMKKLAEKLDRLRRSETATARPQAGPFAFGDSVRSRRRRRWRFGGILEDAAQHAGRQGRDRIDRDVSAGERATHRVGRREHTLALP